MPPAFLRYLQGLRGGEKAPQGERVYASSSRCSKPPYAKVECAGYSPVRRCLRCDGSSPPRNDPPYGDLDTFTRCRTGYLVSFDSASYGRYLVFLVTTSNHPAARLLMPNLATVCCRRESRRTSRPSSGRVVPSQPRYWSPHGSDTFPCLAAVHPLAL